MRTILPFILSLFLCSYGLSQPIDREKAYDFKAKGDKYFQKGEYEKALKFYEDADSLGYITKGDLSWEIGTCSNYVNGGKEKLEAERNFTDSCYKAGNYYLAMRKSELLFNDDYYEDDNHFQFIYYESENKIDFSNLHREADSLMSVGKFEKAGLKYRQLLLNKKYLNRNLKTEFNVKLVKCEADTTEKYYDEHYSIANSCWHNGENECAVKNFKLALMVRTENKNLEELILTIEKRIESDRENFYRQFIYSGEFYIKEFNYTEAKTYFQKALELKNQDSIALAKIKFCEEELKDPLYPQKRFNYLIATGDKNFKTKKYPEAKRNYEMAKEIFPENKYPENKLNEIKKIEEVYKNVISIADSLFNGMNYPRAKLVYEEALYAMPGDKYATEKVQICNGQIFRMKEGEMIRTLKEMANKYFESGEYENAITSYHRILDYIDDPESKDGIEKCKKAISERPPKQDKYSESLKKAYQLFSENKFEEAKKVYQEVSVIKPAEQFPKDMMAKCDAEIKYKQQLNEKEYQEYMKIGAMYMNEKKYDQAIETFEQALKRKPESFETKKKLEEAEFQKYRKN